MCEEIVKLAGVKEYAVNKFPQKQDGDLAIILSESKVDMNAVAIKINTSTQIFQSIRKVSKIAGGGLADEELMEYFSDYPLCTKYLNSSYGHDINVKVYSEFLKDIVSDVGFGIVLDEFDYVIYPDYLKSRVRETENLVEIPSHNAVSKNPFDKAELRYSILENLI